MPSKTTASKMADSIEQCLEQINNEIKRAQPKARQQKLITFAADFFHNISAADIQGREVGDVVGQTLSAWKFLQQFDSDKPKILIFNPDAKKDGWQSNHSVVMLLHADIPFLVDSVRMELSRQEIMIHMVQSTVSQVKRDAKGKLKDRIACDYEQSDSVEDSDYRTEAFAYYEIDRMVDRQAIDRLISALSSVLADVKVVVDDFGAMKAKVMHILSEYEQTPLPFAEEQIKEVETFLQWMLKNNFTFLGFKEYDYHNEARKAVIKGVSGNELGIVKHKEKSTQDKYLSDLSPSLRKFLKVPRLIVFAKSGTLSTVHRPTYPEYIGVRKFDAKGRVIGEYGFLGLYTLPVYTERVRNIPILRQKVDEIMQRSGLYPYSHEGKALFQVLETFPRDELFLTDRDELFRMAVQIAQIKERPQTRLFVREGHYGKFFSCFVYMPREIYNTQIRKKIQRILVDTFKALHSDFTTYFGESILVRTHFVLRKSPSEEVKYDLAKLEQQIIDVTQSWQDQVLRGLVSLYGESQGVGYARRFQNAFPAGYRDTFSPAHAVKDLQYMLSLAGDSLALRFYQEREEQANDAHFTLYHSGNAVPLSDIIPILENTGLKVIGERPFRITDHEGKSVWIHDFSLIYRLGSELDAEKVADIFVAAVAQVWSGLVKDDSFNRLILALALDWRQVSYLRACAHYMTQLRLGLSHEYIADTLLRYQDITRAAVDYFYAKFDPNNRQSQVKIEARLEELEKEYLAKLDSVTSLSEDRVLRRYLELPKAILRTNFFQPAQDGTPKSWFSFKFDPLLIPNIPSPKPMYEIFVYSNHMEGVHLRAGKVARGGLRWSDRAEDYRTEVLGLVKAQQVKNAVIVPVGAKGGFVANRTAAMSDRDEIRAEGIRSYKTFISGLLDITDNLVDDKLVKPEQVVAYDGDDPYLVVAADKGTATFSDTANAISEKYGFWLGDAFASGGSQGYDHKAMGITARGAWVAVQRHFRELGLNTQKDDFTVLGIGDMSGDVFGNGMLLSQHIRLVAAFNHIHIFIDPDPDAKQSYAERKRLFNAERGGWGDYDAKLISKGGGVFLRSAKSITITAEMKKCFAISETKLTPNELLNRLLQAPVDLLWNGGIGTYVKSSHESHDKVGDKANDAIRVNGNELRAKVIGEGGNLGMTQLGRIEYGLLGGHSFTDFIDNAGGVDCSDHEVNIKILLNGVLKSGSLTQAARNKLLRSMTDEVAALVLRNNYRQVQAISIAYSESNYRINEYHAFIKRLEEQHRLNRALEFLPSDEEFKERQQAESGLTRPELAILISYAKAELKERLSQSDIISDRHIAREMETAFPPKLIKKYGDLIYQHSLRKEIVATQLANDLINNLGISFASNMLDQMSISVEELTKAYVISRDVFRLPEIWHAIEALDNKIDAGLQIEMMLRTARLVRHGTRWLLKHRRCDADAATVIARYAPAVELLEQNMSELLFSELAQDQEQMHQRLSQAGVPDGLANFVAVADNLYFALDITEAAQATRKSCAVVAATFYNLSHQLELYWFRQRISQLKTSSHWLSRARDALRDDLDAQLQHMTESVLQSKLRGNGEKRVASWLARDESALAHWRSVLEDMRETESPDLAMYTVAVKELVHLQRRVQ